MTAPKNPGLEPVPAEEKIKQASWLLNRTKKNTDDILAKLDETADPSDDDPLKQTMDEILELLKVTVLGVRALKKENKELKVMIKELQPQGPQDFSGYDDA